MPAWLTRFYAAAALIDARGPTSTPPEMPAEIFQALVDGRIDEIDTLEELDETEDISFADTRPGLAELPLRALALAMLCRALPALDDLARLTATGAITVIACRPQGLAGELAQVLRQLLEAEWPGVAVSLTCTTTAVAAPETRPAEPIAEFWKAVLAGGATRHILVLGDETQLPRRMSRLLPPVIRVGPPDRASVAAALSLADPGETAASGELPSDVALRALEADAWRLALRAPDLATRAAELRRLAEAVVIHGSGALRLEDLALDEGPVRAAARRLVADITAWREGRIGWSEMTRSLLVHGAPGTGKTWLARAIAGSAGLPLIAGSIAEWQAAGHLGDMLREMRACFARARAAAPCVLFLDELDAAGSRGSGDRHASTYRAQVIAGLLEQLDGVMDLEGVLVLAATNHLGAIDPALRRPGRIDRSLALPLPGRAAIRALLARKVGGVLPDTQLDDLARRASGASPAAVDGALREALSRARAASRAVTAADIAGSLGLLREDPLVLRRVAVHEAGHALAFHRLGRGRITGLRIGMQGGQVAVEDLPLVETRQGLEDQLTCWLAGRAAEVLLLGAATTGAGGSEESDLAMATRLAAEIELTTGLGATLAWHAAPEARLATDPALRDRVEAHLQRAHGRAVALLKADRATLAALARRLEAERVIEGDPFGAPRVLPTAGDVLPADDGTAKADSVLVAADDSLLTDARMQAAPAAAPATGGPADV